MGIMMKASRLAALSVIPLVMSVGTTAGPQRDAGAGVSISSGPIAAATIAAFNEPNDPNPAAGARDVPVDTRLSWRVVRPKASGQFRLLASTGGISASLHPFSLVELTMDSVKEVAIGPAYSLGFVACLDSSPEGLLYGADGKFCVIDPDKGSARTVCGTLHTPSGTPVSLTGMAFHPDGTLYGVELDIERFEDVFYVVDLGQCTATEVCRLPSFEASIWGIDFSADGVLYGAFAELVKIDLKKGTASIVGRRFSLPFVNDIDCAPDGFIYAVDNLDSLLYKIDPSTGAVVKQYGPFESELWGVASECLRKVSSSPTAATSRPALEAAWAAGGSTQQDPGGLWLAVESERKALTRRERMLDRVAPAYDNSAAHDEQTRSAMDGGEAQALHAAAAQGGDNVRCDVYLDTINPPIKLVGRDVPPPAVGDVWTYNPGVLRRDKTYYWRVVAKNDGGETKTGRVWSFRTKGPIFQDAFSSVKIDPAQWPVVRGATVDDVGIGEPSGPYSLRLNSYPFGGDLIESRAIDLSGYSGVTLSFRYEQGGGGERPGPDDHLIIEGSVGGIWLELSRESGGAEMISYQRVDLTLPAYFLKSDFKLRFRSIGTNNTEDVYDSDWFLDDVVLSAN